MGAPGSWGEADRGLVLAACLQSPTAAKDPVRQRMARSLMASLQGHLMHRLGDLLNHELAAVLHCTAQTGAGSLDVVTQLAQVCDVPHAGAGFTRPIAGLGVECGEGRRI